MRWKIFCGWYLPVLAALGQVAPAMACTLFPPFIQLPGEPGEAYKLRASSLFAAESDEERRHWQVGQYDRAERVFFARVLKNEDLPTEGIPGRRITVQPLHALKGGLPKMRVQMRENRLSSCQTMVGGSRRSARPDEYTIVFDHTRSIPGDPAAIMEIPVHEARDPRLVQALRNWGAAEARLRRIDPK